MTDQSKVGQVSQSPHAHADAVAESYERLHEKYTATAAERDRLREAVKLAQAATQEQCDAKLRVAAQLSALQAEAARLKEEMDARCDRAYCDGADAVQCIGPAGDDEASVKARREAVAAWKASGYGGRRAASRAALASSAAKGEQDSEFTKGGGLSFESAPNAAATEETGTDRPAAPIYRGDQCPQCATGHARRSQNGLRCANCGWSGPDPDCATPEHKP